jgi:hypothetical protein
MNSYQVCKFIIEHPPKEHETASWFRRVCRMFQNKLPESLCNHLESLSNYNHVLQQLLTTYLAKCKQQEQKQQTDYDAYIVRRDRGNARALQVKVDNAIKVTQLAKEKQDAHNDYMEKESRAIWAPKIDSMIKERQQALEKLLE